MTRPDLDGVKSIADYLDVSPRTVWRWAQGHDPLPLLRTRGGLVVARRRDLELWLARQYQAVTLKPTPASRPVLRRRVFEAR